MTASPASSLLLRLIQAYQHWLSPYKGYACAHRLVYGGPGCSGFGKQAIARHGAIVGLALLRRRLQHCRHAAHQLRARPLPQRQRGFCDGCDVPDCSPDCNPCDLLEFADCCDFGGSGERSPRKKQRKPQPEIEK